MIDTRVQELCGDCGVAIGMAHDPGCDVARCLVYGHQRLACSVYTERPVR